MPTSRSTASAARIFALAAVVVATPAAAWNAGGHRLVADLAWRELDSPVRTRVADLLRAHPDYALWAARARASDALRDRDVFVEASLWADRIRHDARFYDALKEPPTPTLAGFPDMERRRRWHVLNRALPGSGEGGAPAGEIDVALVTLGRTLDGRGATPLERAYALPWLIHLVGDAHQPLHATTRRVAGKAEDDDVFNPFNARKRRTSLHAYWDDLPGAALRGERLAAASAALLAAYPAPPPSTSADWLAESWALARDYGSLPAGTLTISAEFDAQSHEIARRRVAQAGHRLAALLNRALASR